MTTRDFIERTYNTTNDKWGKYGYERRCSSVLTSRDGVVYSYGYHYPLAFQVAGLNFINSTGYSSSTAKHIAWARQAIGYNNYINVELWRVDNSKFNNGTENDRLDVILGALMRKEQSLIKQMEAKKRKDTQIYARLRDERDQVLADYRRVVAVV